MAKRKLIQILNEMGEDISKSEESLHILIFGTDRLNELREYNTLIGSLTSYATEDVKNRGVLMNALKKANESLEGVTSKESATNTADAVKILHRRYGRNEGKQSTNGNSWISYDAAVSYWRSRDIKEGREPVTESGYRQRINNLKKKRKIKVERNGNRIKTISQKGLDKAIGEYQYSKGNSRVLEARHNGQWIYREDAIEMYKQMERNFGITDVATQDAYRLRIDSLIDKKGLRTKDTPEGYLISQRDFINKVTAKLTESTGKSPYSCFVQLVEQEGLSKEDSVKRLGLTGKMKRAVLANYSRYKEKSKENN